MGSLGACQAKDCGFRVAHTRTALIWEYPSPTPDLTINFAHISQSNVMGQERSLSRVGKRETHIFFGLRIFTVYIKYV